MLYKTLLILVWTVVRVVVPRRPFIIIISDLSCIGYGKPILHTGCHLETVNNRTVINAFVVLSEEVNDFQIKASAEFPRNGATTKLFDFTVDGCKTLGKMDSFNILKVALSFVRKSGHIPSPCPLSADENFTLNRFFVDPDMLPSYTPEFSYSAELQAIIGSKIVGRILVKGRIETKRKRVL